jgi:hypothetical protein
MVRVTYLHRAIRTAAESEEHINGPASINGERALSQKLGVHGKSAHRLGDLSGVLLRILVCLSTPYTVENEPCNVTYCSIKIATTYQLRH